jgi:hypothetical protein
MAERAVAPERIRLVGYELADGPVYIGDVLARRTAMAGASVTSVGRRMLVLGVSEATGLQLEALDTKQVYQISKHWWKSLYHAAPPDPAELAWEGLV